MMPALWNYFSSSTDCYRKAQNECTWNHEWSSWYVWWRRY